VIAAAIVSVLIDGVRVDGSIAARLRGGVVVAPLEPYLAAIAQRIEPDQDGLRFVFERGSRSVTVSIGSQVARSGPAVESLPIAPYLRGGEAFIPLAAVARDLGADVDFDGATKTLRVSLPPEPLATLTPPAAGTPWPGPFVTFAPAQTPAPAPSLSGIPRPRRTPIVIDSHER
jgi:hypothetical protein